MSGWWFQHSIMKIIVDPNSLMESSEKKVIWSKYHIAVSMIEHVWGEI